MKSLFVLLFLPIFSFGISKNDLLKTTCVFYENNNEDPKLSISFSPANDREDFIKVIVSERIYPKFRKDETYVEVFNDDVQVAQGNQTLSIDSDNGYFTLQISGEIPDFNKAIKPNGSLSLAKEKVKVICEKM